MISFFTKVSAVLTFFLVCGDETRKWWRVNIKVLRWYVGNVSPTDEGWVSSRNGCTFLMIYFIKARATVEALMDYFGPWYVDDNLHRSPYALIGFFFILFFSNLLTFSNSTRPTTTKKATPPSPRRVPSYLCASHHPKRPPNHHRDGSSNSNSSKDSRRSSDASRTLGLFSFLTPLMTIYG